MRLDTVQDLARTGRLYPSVILYGTSPEGRRNAALTLARTLLCETEPATAPCGSCRACRRIDWPGENDHAFHPDFFVLERDLRTSTSVEATKSFLRAAYRAPFEARGQVFVIAEAETLTVGAADALLKILEEPPERTPRHFLLLATNARDLVPTLRSRSLSLFLGAGDALDTDKVASMAVAFGAAAERFRTNGASIDLLGAADALGDAGGWQDARARRPWATAAAAVLHHAKTRPAGDRRALLETAAALLDGPRMRLRGIPYGRILEGLLSRHLAGS